MFGWIPWDIRLAVFAAVIVALAAVYEFSPIVASFLFLALASFVVAVVVND